MSNIFHLLKKHAAFIKEKLESSEKKRIYNISISHLALLLSFNEKPFIVIEDSEESALSLFNDLLFFSSIINQQLEIFHFPIPSNPESIGQRARAIYKFIIQDSKSKSSIITSKDSYKTGFNILKEEIDLLKLHKGMEIKRQELDDWLRSKGYRKVNLVMEKGEFSQRGWLFDIYPVTEEYPIRVEFFGDEIDLIRKFDIETQRSIKEIKEVEIFPAEEGELKHNLIEDLTNIRDFDLFIVDSLLDISPTIRFIAISHLPIISEGVNSEEMTIKGLGIVPEERRSIDYISESVKKLGKRIVFVMSSMAQAERLKEIVFEKGIIAPIIENKSLSTYEGIFCITTGMLSLGINLPEIMILTDKEIFGERPSFRSIKKSKISGLLRSIEDLNIGDFIVHKDHGIGRFAGLQRKKTNEYEQDLITIEYLNGIVYVPFHSVNKIQKYSAAEGHIPSLDRLGTKTWQRTKEKVQKGIKEMAERLLRLYAERKVVRGFRFSEDTPIHKEFDDFFPYEETEDQIKAIEEIKRLMNSDMPMDMLLCGDVGYGKTEIAIRAAFRAVYDGKQVAVLVPTTLLAEQHYRTFKARFSGFPININYLSRFKNYRDIKKTISSLSKGEIDIIIGTHMLLNKNVHFRDLGLLIIDEEHRFGVAQKERLKELKKNVDVLTLSATPIPRTLQMSLSGIRQMCTIETPPEERIAVKSIVTIFNEEIIKEAIERELRRGGQVFFVHNRITDIEKIADFIKKIVPYAQVAIAHGRMKERDLEEIMIRFLDKKLDILICTAIIGSGLDITTANTIIVNRADSFGLSDLYQLKGRVGRGNVQAYAYFLIPGEDIISDDAKKRLKAIQEMSYLGAGFRVALKDLEIRGAGNLLGAEQSGHIYKVGFDLYMEMLEKAVAELKGQEIAEEVEPQIRLKISAFIPEEYIPDISLRLSFYRRLSSLKSLDDLFDLKDELVDRFGKIPEEVENLIHVIRIKLYARSLYIERIFDLDGRYRFYFVSDSEKYRIKKDFFDRLIHILFDLQKKEKKLRFMPDGFELNIEGLNTKNSLLKIEGLLNNIWTTMQK